MSVGWEETEGTEGKNTEFMAEQMMMKKNKSNGIKN